MFILNSFKCFKYSWIKIISCCFYCFRTGIGGSFGRPWKHSWSNFQDGVSYISTTNYVKGFTEEELLNSIGLKIDSVNSE